MEVSWSGGQVSSLVSPLLTTWPLAVTVCLHLVTSQFPSVGNEYGAGMMRAAQSTPTTPVADPLALHSFWAGGRVNIPPLWLGRGHVTSSGQTIMSRGDKCHF